MPKTYEPISTQTLGSAAASVTFSSIPSTYTDLVLVNNFTLSINSYQILQFNGDTASNYSCTVMSSNGTTASSNRYSNEAYLNLTSAAGTQATIIQIQNYSNTTTFKTYLSRYANASTETTAFVGMWRNTAAINSVTIKFPNSANFSIGSTFTLYGIKAA
jgi:hypothetical protein